MEIFTWKVRYKKDVSLRVLAELTGIPKSTLGDIENGRKIPDILQLEKIAKATETHISDMFESEYQ